MWSFVARRLATAVVTLIGITLVTFVLIHAVPGDPVSYYAGRSGFRASPAALAAVRAQHHLDRPLLTQYGYWVRDLARFDFGTSVIAREPVALRVARKLPNTLLLNLAALIVAIGLGLPFGIWSASRPGRGGEAPARVAVYILAALPTFWVALLLMQLFAVRLEWLPLFGMSSVGNPTAAAAIADRLRHLILPTIALSLAQIAVFARFSRAAFAEVLHSDYMTTARAKGLPERTVLWKHGFRNAVVPLITLLGLTVPYLLSGSVVVEQIFQWDGVGMLFVDSILSRDYPTVMALTVITAMATLVSGIAADLLYGAADPRISAGERR